MSMEKKTYLNLKTVQCHENLILEAHFCVCVSDAVPPEYREEKPYRR